MGARGEVPSLCNQNGKIFPNSLTQQSLPKSYQAASGFLTNFKASTFVQWASCPPGTQPGQQNTGTLIFAFFRNGISKGFGLKNGKSLRLAPKRLKSNEAFHHKQKITKILHMDPWAAAVKLGLQLFGPSNRFLNKKNQISV